jgi:hypothetical protein
MDVGVDTNDLRPYNWSDIVQALKDQEYEPVDHHRRTV